MKVLKKPVMADFKVGLSPEDMSNSEGFNLRDTIRRNKADHDEEIHKENLQATVDMLSALGGKVAEVGHSRDDKLSILFDALVPSSGKADTVAGELIRAINRLIYRDWNDGDLFYRGYGLETCGSCVAYIVYKIPSLESDFSYIAENRLEDDAYTEHLGEIQDKIIDYIFNNLYEVAEPNTEDCIMGKWDISDIVDWAGTEDIYISYPGLLMDYLEKGVIRRRDIEDRLQDWLDFHWGTTYDNYARVWAGDSDCEISNLTPDTYAEVEEHCYDWLEDWAEELYDKFGDPDDVEDGEEE